MALSGVPDLSPLRMMMPMLKRLEYPKAPTLDWYPGWCAAEHGHAVVR